jgi:hypothetical protein
LIPSSLILSFSGHLVKSADAASPLKNGVGKGFSRHELFASKNHVTKNTFDAGRLNRAPHPLIGTTRSMAPAANP